MIKTDTQGNLFTIMGNSAVFSIKDLPKKKGTLAFCVDGDSELKKEFAIDGQSEVIIKLSKQDIEDIGVGEHPFYVDIISNDGEDVDTVINQVFVVFGRL